MGKLTLGFGMLLVLIGVVTYFATGGASITALIPTLIGNVSFSQTGVGNARPRLPRSVVQAWVWWITLLSAGIYVSYDGFVTLHRHQGVSL